MEVSIYGIRDRQIWVEIDPDRLDRYSLTLQQVAGALAAKNMNVPAGELKIGQLEYLLRTVGEFDSIDQIQSVIVQQIPGGGKIRIRDNRTGSRYLRRSDRNPPFEQQTSNYTLSSKTG